jgi:hypothetical protein
VMWKKAARAKKQKRAHDRSDMREAFGWWNDWSFYDTPLLVLHVLVSVK